MKKNALKTLVLAPLALLAITLFIALGGGIVLLLWNWLLPPLFGLPQVTFWQALGLLALCRILFGGFSSRGSIRDRFRRRLSWRMQHLTPDEKERIRQRMRERWGCEAPAEEGESQ